MGNQLSNYGKSVKAVLTAGVQSTKSDIPLGQKFEDGERVYRWAFIKVASVPPGVGLVAKSVMSTTSTTILSGADGLFNSATAGWGGGAGDTKVKLYGASGLTDEDMYEDGTFEIVSGPGKGFSYKVNSYERGGTGVNVLQLEDPIVVKLSTTTQAYLRPNKYYGLGLQGAALSGTYQFVRGGVTTMSVTASGYCLVQTKGPGIGQSIAALSAGRAVAPMNVSGQISAVVVSTTAGDVQPWGYTLGASAGADDYLAVDWCIE